MNDTSVSTGRGVRESERLAELHAYRILRTPREREFDDVVELAAHIAEAPVSFIGFVDGVNEWFKASVGLEIEEVPRERTYCQFVVGSGRPVVIPDTRATGAPMPETGIPALPGDGRDREIRFYVGVPIIVDSRQVLGTLCVVDYEPRASVAPELVSMLERLSRQVSGRLELRRANALLFEERDTFSVLFEAAPAPLLLVRDGVIVRANHAFAAMVTDGDASSLESRDLSAFIEDVPDTTDSATESTVRNEFGQTIPVLVFHTRLTTGRRVYNLFAVADISDRKEKERVLEEQRLKAENANRIKDTFLSLVSHDLKSPLSGIFTMLDLLDRAGDSFSADELRDTIREMRSSAAVLVEMINQLLNIHRLQSGRVELNLEPVNVRSAVDQVCLTLRVQIEAKEVDLEIDVAPDLHLVADGGLVREAVFNLVSNAVKFAPTGGVIRIVARGRSIAVEDTGPGVPVEDRPDLFRHEVKTSRPGSHGERGTGLGLPLVADIMRAHGGTVSLDEEYTSGARFVLEFPPSATSLHP